MVTELVRTGYLKERKFRGERRRVVLSLIHISTEPLRLRHEVKHQLSPPEALVLTSRLQKLFPRDGHAGPDGSYRVTSLYFDTPYDTALREKLDGVDRREKFRLRYYGERPDFLKLEKKWKVNGCLLYTSRCV